MRYLFAKKRNAMNERKRISHQKEEADECSDFGDHRITVVNSHTHTHAHTETQRPVCFKSCDAAKNHSRYQNLKRVKHDLQREYVLFRLHGVILSTARSTARAAAEFVDLLSVTMARCRLSS